MPRKWIVHQASNQGMRTQNEDEHRVVTNLFQETINRELAPIDYFCIMDGHGGDEVAKYIATPLCRFFTGKSHSKNIFQSYPIDENKINTAFKKLQDAIVNHPQNIGAACGSTVLIVVRYIKNGKDALQIINLGDCRAVICRNGKPIFTTMDHKPHWPNEKVRIEKVNYDMRSNKHVEFIDGAYRIGDLSVSRAMGDLDNTPHVTHTPEIYNYFLNDKDEFMVLACDGLWDVLQPQDVINFVRDHINNNMIDAYNIRGVYPSNKVKKSDSIAEKLAEYAIASGSSDNVTIIIVIF